MGNHKSRKKSGGTRFQRAPDEDAVPTFFLARPSSTSATRVAKLRPENVSDKFSMAGEMLRNMLTLDWPPGRGQHTLKMRMGTGVEHQDTHTHTKARMNGKKRKKEKRDEETEER